MIDTFICFEFLFSELNETQKFSPKNIYLKYLISDLYTNEQKTSIVSKSRIDAIWTTEDTIQNILFFKLVNLCDDLSTNHKAILISIDYTEWTNWKYITWKCNANQCKQALWNTTDISKKQWSEFKKLTDSTALNSHNIDQAW